MTGLLSSQEKKHELVIELGRGGMSRVYLAMIRGPGGFNKLVVIKRLLADLASDPDFRQMFLEEARLSARLNHQNIVAINEVGSSGDNFYIEMEYLEGQSFETILRRAEGTMPADLQLRILVDALAGLHYAHEFCDFDGRHLAIVHRDVSPHNIFVTYDGHVKIVDFGIAKAADSSQQTQTGVLKGKCAYMAPEQFLGKGVDRRVDVFACGVILWRVATGRRLWKDMSEIEIFKRLSTGEIPTPSSVRPDVAPELEAICVKALAPRSEDRHASAADLKEAIEDYLASGGKRVGQREIGQFVSKLFADDRAKVRSAIEAQLNAQGADRAVAEITGEVPALHALVPHTQQTDSVADNRSALALTPPARARRSPLAFVILGVALAVGAGLAYSNLIRRQTTTAPNAASSGPTLPTTPPVAVPSTSSSTDASAVVSSPATDFIQLTLKATPPEARFRVDDIILSTNPVTQRLVRDGKAHHVVAEAQGYARADRMVNFATPVGSIEFTLSKVPQQPVFVAKTPSKTKSTAATQTPAEVIQPSPPATAETNSPAPPPAPPKNKPIIDKTDPYNKGGD